MLNICIEMCSDCDLAKNLPETVQFLVSKKYLNKLNDGYLIYNNRCNSNFVGTIDDWPRAASCAAVTFLQINSYFTPNPVFSSIKH